MPARQATFLALIRKGQRLQEEASIEAWLHRVAFNLASEELRKELRRKNHEREAAMHAVEPEGERVCDERILATLHEELANLSGQDRKAVILHHMRGLSYAKATSRSACTSEAFGVRLARAREKLRKRLVKRGVQFSGVGLAAALQQCAQVAEFRADPAPVQAI